MPGGLDTAAAAKLEEARIARILSSIQDALDLQEADVDRRRSSLMELMKEHGIIDFSIMGGQATTSKDRPIQLAALKEELGKMEAKLHRTSGLSGAALYAAFREEGDPTIKLWLEQLQKDKLELARLDTSGFGPRHPRRIGVAKQIEEEEKILLSASDNYRKSLEVTIGNLKTQLAGSQATAAPVAPEALKQYEEVKLRYTIALDTLNQMKSAAIQLRMGALLLLSPDSQDAVPPPVPATEGPRAIVLEPVNHD